MSELGDKLRAIRRRMIDSGQKLLALDEIEARLGGYEDVLADLTHHKQLLDKAITYIAERVHKTWFSNLFDKSRSMTIDELKDNILADLEQRCKDIT